MVRNSRHRHRASISLVLDQVIVFNNDYDLVGILSDHVCPLLLAGDTCVLLTIRRVEAIVVPHIGQVATPSWGQLRSRFHNISAARSRYQWVPVSRNPG